ncbi:MAG: hypothetical protein B6U95_00890 [Thermofilum sp. ex4484_82]|nr:MAG: hypothetical protein B6U95_00890 [Thermofilum sp. ex4484_82]OYT39957.1 MAG: hypothetical protein B6U96_00895 [Archaeoglobales archaeon ex4484_92]RLE75214.1 MAG: UbiD family decarboxylase [Thermoprotei archaeon]
MLTILKLYNGQKVMKSGQLREFLEKETARGRVLKVKEVFSSKYQATKLIKQYDAKMIVLFENIDYKPFKVVANTILNRKQLLEIFEVANHVNAYKRLLDACEHPADVLVTSKPKNLEAFEGDLNDLPILTYYEGDAGPYITAGIVVAKDCEEKFQNISIHRMLVIDEKHLVIRIVPRHLYRILQKAKKRGENLKVAVLLGVHPFLLLAAASSPPYGVDELKVAAKLLNGLTVFKSNVSGLLLPTDCEIILEGEILIDREEWEGPFVDITGTHDIKRRQPVLRVDRILVKKEKPIYQAILPAGTEHKLLMGFYREAKIWHAVKNVVPSVKEVRLTDGGCGWLSCVISIQKVNEGDPKNAMLAAFAAHPSLKMVIVVDEDINVDNPVEIEWAMVTRMQPDKDLLVISGVRGSSLDPSADQEKMLTSKLGIDATIPLNKPREHFIKKI